MCTRPTVNLSQIRIPPLAATRDFLPASPKSGFLALSSASLWGLLLSKSASWPSSPPCYGLLRQIVTGIVYKNRFFYSTKSEECAKSRLRWSPGWWTETLLVNGSPQLTQSDGTPSNLRQTLASQGRIVFQTDSCLINITPKHQAPIRRHLTFTNNIPTEIKWRFIDRLKSNFTLFFRTRSEIPPLLDLLLGGNFIFSCLNDQRFDKGIRDGGRQMRVGGGGGEVAQSNCLHLRCQLLPSSSAS